MPLLLLAAGLTVGAVGYGGFSRPYAVALAVLVSLAAVVGLLDGTFRRGRAGVPVGALVAAVALLALGAWALARGSWTPDVWSGLPMAALTLGCAVVLVLVCSAARPQQQLLVLTLLLLGAGVSLVGWFGALTHSYPLAVADQGVWRASGPLGYPNALAGLLGPLVLVAAGRQAGQGSRGGAVLLALLLAGWMTAFSRGGAVAMAVGMTLLLVMTPARPLLRAVWAPLLGALVILAGLAPSLRDGSGTSVAPAVLALPLGLVVAALPWLPRLREPAATPVAAAASAILLVGVGWGALRHGRAGAEAVEALVSGKVTLDSSYRIDQHGAAWRVLADHPLTGVGPGMADLRWIEADGSVLVARYVHDEYVQVLVETGLFGGVLLGVVLAAVAITLATGRQRLRAAPVAGLVAAVAAFAVHSGLDFLWHLPVLPLLACCLVAVAAGRRVPAPPGTGTQDTAVSRAVPDPAPAQPSPHPAG